MLFPYKPYPVPRVLHRAWCSHSGKSKNSYRKNTFVAVSAAGTPRLGTLSACHDLCVRGADIIYTQSCLCYEHEHCEANTPTMNRFCSTAKFWQLCMRQHRSLVQCFPVLNCCRSCSPHLSDLTAAVFSFSIFVYVGDP